jgi:endonuclease/exonuclease/phosphatase family metal-dependent hydrolase
MGIVFLNCFLRSPKWIFFDQQSDRISLIPKYTIVDQNTLIGLCEVFGKSFGKKLEAEYQKHRYNFKQATDASSGLAIAFPKKYKLQYEHFVKYNDSKLPDSLANKGFMHYILKCKDCDNHNNIIVTHLQSSYPEYKQHGKTYTRYREIQKNQLDQLKKYITDNNINEYILMGDFNIVRDTSDNLFNYFIKLFNYERKLHLLPSTSTFPEHDYVLDYIFVKFNKSKKNHNKITTLDDRAKNIVSKNKNVSYISDHYAIQLL